MSVAYFLILQKNKNTGDTIIREAEAKGKDILARAEQSAQISRKEIEEAKNDIRDRKQSAVEHQNRLAEKE